MEFKMKDQAVKFKYVHVDEISISNRFRNEYGDIHSLAASINSIGLLHPIVVDSNLTLIAGGRRLQAVKQLNWTSVPCTVAKTLDDAILAVQAERDENTCRLELQVSEKVALGLRLEELEKPKAKERQTSGKGRDGSGGRGNKNLTKKNSKVSQNTNMTDAKVGEQIGMSHATYRKAKEVIESGDKKIIDEMNRTGKVGPAANRVKQKKKQEELQEATIGLRMMT